MRKAVFLDRDGVINKDTGYVCHWSDFEFVDGAVDAMRHLCERGYALVIVTNQSGLARGKYTLDDYQALTEAMLAYLKRHQVEVTAVYHCPHHPGGKVAQWAVPCDCRKPEPGMILRGLREHGLDPAQSFLVGDKPSDIEAARRAGLGRAYIVASDNDESNGEWHGADAGFEDLFACVNAVLRD